MNYTKKGSENGELIVFVNGGGVGHWMWQYQYECFKEYKCIFFDLPGHRENSHIDYISINHTANLIKDIIITESVDGKANIIGFSNGAQIALELLDKHSKHILRAVIVSALNKPIPLFKIMLKPMLALSMPFMKSRKFAKANAKKMFIPEALFENFYEDSVRISKKTLTNLYIENMSYKYEGAPTNIPVLILVGENEIKMMIQSARELHALIPSSKAYIVENVSHAIPYAKSKLFNESIQCFFNNKVLELSNVDGLKELA